MEALLPSLTVFLRTVKKIEPTIPVLAGRRWRGGEGVEPIQTKKPRTWEFFACGLLYHLQVPALVASFRMKDDIADLLLF
jgi:hypothetical protein